MSLSVRRSSALHGSVSYSEIMEIKVGWRITQCLYTGKCSCKEKKLRSVSDLCKTKHDYGEKISAVFTRLKTV